MEFEVADAKLTDEISVEKVNLKSFQEISYIENSPILKKKQNIKGMLPNFKEMLTM